MAQKLSSTESTFIYAGDSSLGSLNISRIQTSKMGRFTKRLSNSLQNLINPFQQTLALKFPKRRIRKEGPSHILFESETPIYKTCIRTSKLRNKQLDQKPRKKQKGQGIYFRYQDQSEDGILYNYNKSLQNENKYLFSSPDKTAKRYFHKRIMQQTKKDPILIGEQQKVLCNDVYKKFAQKAEVKRNQGQGFKENIQWKVNKSAQKQRFHYKYNVKKDPNSQNAIKLQGNCNMTRRNQACKISILRDRPRTYKQLYNQRKNANK